MDNISLNPLFWQEIYSKEYVKFNDRLAKKSALLLSLDQKISNLCPVDNSDEFSKTLKKIQYLSEDITAWEGMRQVMDCLYNSYLHTTTTLSSTLGEKALKYEGLYIKEKNTADKFLDELVPLKLKENGHSE